MSQEVKHCRQVRGSSGAGIADGLASHVPQVMVLRLARESLCEDIEVRPSNLDRAAEEALLGQQTTGRPDLQNHEDWGVPRGGIRISTKLPGPNVPLHEQVEGAHADGGLVAGQHALHGGLDIVLRDVPVMSQGKFCILSHIFAVIAQELSDRCQDGAVDGLFLRDANASARPDRRLGGTQDGEIIACDLDQHGVALVCKTSKRVGFELEQLQDVQCLLRRLDVGGCAGR
mmetsp:Transcript_157069/g.503961  ORF Transcript_157069/g.503961 Transcript_157069/m.503961 type:complete len:230 (+) Transcript_157069:1103-1792(+)